MPPDQKPDGALLIHSKADIVPAPPEADLAVSALTGQGLAQLTELLVARAADLIVSEGEVALNARHRQALAKVIAALDEARADDPLIAAEALRLARAALDRITGRAGVENMLDALFGRFCIGK